MSAIAQTRFSFPCRRCGSVLESSLEQAGQSGRCPTCGSVFDIPTIDPRTGLKSSRDTTTHADANPVHAYAAAGSKAPDLIESDEGDLSIVCSRCMRRSDVESDACGHCGMPFTIDGAAQYASELATPRASFAIVLGVLGLALLACWTLGAVGVSILGVALAVSANLQLDSAPGKVPRRLAWSALAITGVALVAGTLRLVLS